LPKRDVELVDASVLVFSNTGLASCVPEPPFPFLDFKSKLLALFLDGFLDNLLHARLLCLLLFTTVPKVTFSCDDVGTVEFKEALPLFLPEYT
jgi:hypothetical protein